MESVSTVVTTVMPMVAFMAFIGLGIMYVGSALPLVQDWKQENPRAANSITLSLIMIFMMAGIVLIMFGKGGVVGQQVATQTAVVNVAESRGVAPVVSEVSAGSSSSVPVFGYGLMFAVGIAVSMALSFVLRRLRGMQLVAKQKRGDEKLKRGGEVAVRVLGDDGELVEQVQDGQQMAIKHVQ